MNNKFQTIGRAHLQVDGADDIEATVLIVVVRHAVQ